MTYEVLARKWRPQGFDDVVGQQHVTTPLRNAIRSDRVPHAVLLTGPRGVGKTTLARILARCLNCEKGPTDTPCGQCPECSDITAGHSTDVQEIDAASRTSVDDVREIIEAIHYAPSPGKYRIYVVDEVHMLSTAAFNALLKTLEEPPPRSLFVFATTNPEKLPFTVISRCQRYDLRRIAAAEIVERLQLIGRDEGIEVSEASLLAIAREADGSLRDAQTLLDQVIAFGGTRVDDEQVAQVLDLIDRRLLLGILEACVDADPAAALEACVQAAAAGADARRLGESLLQMLRDLVVLRIAPERQGLVEGADAEISELRAIAERTEAPRLRRMFRALIKEQEDLAWAPDPRAVLEMAVVRLASMPAGDDVARLLSRLEALERRLSGGGGADSSGGAAPPAAEEPKQKTGGARRRRPEGSKAGPAAQAGPTPEPAPDPAPAEAGAAPDDVAPPAAVRTDGAGAAAAPDDAALLDGAAPLGAVFQRLTAFANRRNPRLAAALEGGALLERGEERLRLAVPNRFAAQRLTGRRQILEELCTEFFGRPLQVEVESPERDRDAEPVEAPVETDRQLRQRALEHPAVGTALEVLGGEISEIRPLSRGGPER